jgi:hypothetical protein
MKLGLASHCVAIPRYSAQLERTSADLLAAKLGSMWLLVFTRLWLHVFSPSVNDVHGTRNCTHGLGRISCDACRSKYSVEHGLAAVLCRVPNSLREAWMYGCLRYILCTDVRYYKVKILHQCLRKKLQFRKIP